MTFEKDNKEEKEFMHNLAHLTGCHCNCLSKQKVKKAMDSIAHIFSNNNDPVISAVRDYKKRLKEKLKI